MDHLALHIESLIFCSKEPISLDDIKRCLLEITGTQISDASISDGIVELQNKYDADTYSFSIVQLAGGYQFLTKPAYQLSISIFLKNKSKKRLSTSSLETLAIVAYRQPVTKSQIEHIRGVNSDYAIQKLLERELIEIKGRAETLGRPVVYGTGKYFMEYFGVNSINELPQPKDVALSDNELGEPIGE